MAVFASAGHDIKNVGAQSNGYSEEVEMIKFRDLFLKHYKSMITNDYKLVCDKDTETLAQYLKRIETGEGSVVIEFHLDASNNTAVSGVSTWVGNDADKLDLAFAKELAEVGAKSLCLPNRGVHKESESYHKKLGLMREQGTVCLVELCFITNKKDMQNYTSYMNTLAFNFAKVVKKYEDMIK